MSETKGERRERRRKNSRKMGVTGRSVILLHRIVARRAEEAKGKGS